MDEIFFFVLGGIRTPRPGTSLDAAKQKSLIYEKLVVEKCLLKIPYLNLTSWELGVVAVLFLVWSFYFYVQ